MRSKTLHVLWGEEFVKSDKFLRVNITGSIIPSTNGFA